jgi:heterodisulfide reductase subunit A-like polyferredoxin
MPVAAQIAWVDPDKCISCMTCLKVCPYQAPRIGKNNKAEIQEAVCMGCGSCTATCPAKAIILHNYVDTQVLGAIDGLLGARTLTGPEEPLFLETVGITQTRWHHKENKHG